MALFDVDTAQPPLRSGFEHAVSKRTSSRLCGIEMGACIVPSCTSNTRPTQIDERAGLIDPVISAPTDVQTSGQLSDGFLERPLPIVGNPDVAADLRLRSIVRHLVECRS